MTREKGRSEWRIEYISSWERSEGIRKNGLDLFLGAEWGKEIGEEGTLRYESKAKQSRGRESRYWMKKLIS